MSMFNLGNENDILSPEKNGYGTAQGRVRKVFWIVLIFVAICLAFGIKAVSDMSQQNQNSQSNYQTYDEENEFDDDDEGMDFGDFFD